MKLVANIKLVTSTEESDLLKRTLERSNEACNWLSAKAIETKTFRQFDLHHLCYHELRERFELAANVAVRCISKVADAYKIGRKNVQRKFRKHSAQPYDQRIISFKANNIVSIWTLKGRLKIRFLSGKHQRDLLQSRKGEVDLAFIRGNWYLACVCDIIEPNKIRATKALGIDLGLVNIATSSDGSHYCGKSVEKNRLSMAKRRTGLQRRGTKAAKRKLRKLSGKQRRFQKHENHCIAKAIVIEAERSGRAIALEDLKGIRERIKARRSQRGRLGNWSFGQIRTFITYKAQRAGIPILFVDPKYTSRECPECGVIDKANRPDQATFSCVSCGHSGHADVIAAHNIRCRAEAALVTRP